MFEKRISIFTGHFGSGKTEVAVNYAIKTKELGSRTAIVDLDIVNPYFRTADAKEDLEKRGIKVILPMYANTNVDVPSLPPEINMLFEDKGYRVVLDIGGDDLGARVVSRYRDEITADDFDLFFVVNTRRPMTNTAEKIIEVIYEIEASANMKITGLVSNTNLLGETTEADIMEGHRIIMEASRLSGVPVSFISGLRENIAQLEESTGGIPVLRMEKYIKLPWDRG